MVLPTLETSSVQLPAMKTRMKSSSLSANSKDLSSKLGRQAKSFCCVDINL